MMCKNHFPMYSFEGGKFERCEHGDDTSIVDGDQEGVKC